MKMTPTEFLAARGRWLTDEGSMRAQQNDRGQWEVVVRVDGFYARRSDAERAVRDFGGVLRSAVNQARHAEGDQRILSN